MCTFELFQLLCMLCTTGLLGYTAYLLKQIVDVAERFEESTSITATVARAFGKTFVSDLFPKLTPVIAQTFKSLFSLRPACVPITPTVPIPLKPCLFGGGFGTSIKREGATHNPSFTIKRHRRGADKEFAFENAAERDGAAEKRTEDDNCNTENHAENHKERSRAEDRWSWHRRADGGFFAFDAERDRTNSGGEEDESEENRDVDDCIRRFSSNPQHNNVSQQTSSDKRTEAGVNIMNMANCLLESDSNGGLSPEQFSELDRSFLAKTSAILSSLPANKAATADADAADADADAAAATTINITAINNRADNPATSFAGLERSFAVQSAALLTAVGSK